VSSPIQARRIRPYRLADAGATGAAAVGLGASAAVRAPVSPRMAPEPLRQPPAAAAAMMTIHLNLLIILHLHASVRRETSPASGLGPAELPHIIGL
jgi:hypothetical protein